MKIRNLLEIRKAIYSLLRSDERMIAFSTSRTSSSAYCILVNELNEYVCFRVSDHYTSPFYSNRTFYIENDLEKLRENIRKYLDNISWYKFKYSDFYGLQCLKQMKLKKMSIYIDNSAEIFDRAKMGMLFYQIVDRSRNKKEIHTVSESFQKHLRKFYASGLISETKLFDNTYLVYVTAEGLALIEHSMPLYINKFLEDFDSINLNYVEIE